MPTISVSANTLFTISAKKIIIKVMGNAEIVEIKDADNNTICVGNNITEYMVEFDTTRDFSFKANTDVEVTYE